MLKASVASLWFPLTHARCHHRTELTVTQVTHYGLPAAGIILLKTLARRRQQGTGELIKASVLRNLHIFVAETETGAVVQPTEANYALLSQAVQTIKVVLDSIACCCFIPQSPQDTLSLDFMQDSPQNSIPQLDLDNFEFEIGFWQNLADYSSVLDGGQSLAAQADNL